MPAHSFDPYFYRAHKAKGGTFQNYKDKTYLTLTDAQIEKHLKGDQLVGIYPLLTDNSSWFITADFDDEKWEEECRAFVSACKEKGITAYLERSRSGKGGHVWIFFEQPYPDLHEKTILKLRFVLSPFSFVFLLKGKINYHIILETLDTEEATYMWYFDADKRGLPAILKLIDEDLNTIRNKGRQTFLESAPINFSRVHHDYSDDRKGFVNWKDSLEERLT
jgi:hypothetical protein